MAHTEETKGIARLRRSAGANSQGIAILTLFTLWMLGLLAWVRG